MKIVHLQAENIKRLVAVEITPDGNLVEITGKNGQGKTSILDAILWAIGGNKIIQSRPIRKGAERGFVRLDLGEYIVTKKFKMKDDGEVTISLTVENKDGAKYSSPQELLNKFLGDLTFDPLAFSRMKPRDQVTALRALVPDYDFEDADTRSKDFFAKRTEVNRTIRDLKGRVEAIVIPDEEVTHVSVEELLAELQAALDHNSAVTREQANIEAMVRDIAHLNEANGSNRAQIVRREREIEDIREEIQRIERAIKHNDSEIERIDKEASEIVVADPVDTQPIRDKIAAAETTNALARTAADRKALVVLMSERQAESDKLTAEIDGITEASAKAVASANLPIEGLTLTDEQILLHGLPFDQASDAEQLRASISIAGAMNPKLRVIRVRDGSLLDQDSMALLTKYAEENDLQVWIETVSSGRESAVLIEEGQIVSKSEAAE